ncbi:MAG: hypothetical protein H0W25_18610 [Acidimicrobiia bacterium]|nr:hypothetical protein [Acidimicrobiia bacterium]
MRLFSRKPRERSNKQVGDLRARARDLDLGWVEELARDGGVASHEAPRPDAKRRHGRPG